jgi:hypothetical protein
MNRPPLPTILSAKRTRRPGQNLTSLAPGPRGAVLLPVIPKIPQSPSWILETEGTKSLAANRPDVCWIPLPHFEFRFCPVNASVATVFDGQP